MKCLSTRLAAACLLAGLSLTAMYCGTSDEGGLGSTLNANDTIAIGGDSINVTVNAGDSITISGDTTSITINDSTVINVITNNGSADSGRYSGSITGRVFSAANNLPLSGITVNVTGDQEGNVGASRSVATDSNGYYQFQSLVLGDYLLTIENNATYSGKKGEAMIVVPAGHPAIGGNSIVNVNVKCDFELLPLTATLTGYAFVEKDKVLAKSFANRFAAESVYVQIYIENEIPDRYTAYTNASGQFTLANLPATALRNIDATVAFMSYVDADGTPFAQVSKTVQLQTGSNTVETAYFTTVTEPLMLLQSNAQSIAANSFGLTTPILLILSSEVDASRLTSVRLENGGSDVPVVVTVNQDSLTVTPTVALTAGSTYSLIYTLYSADGRSTGLDTLTFSTIMPIKLIYASYKTTDQVKQRIGIGDNIVLVFNKAPSINATETVISLDDAIGKVMATVTASHETLTVNPSNNLASNTEYYLSITNLQSTVLGDNFSMTDTFSTEFSAAPVSAVSGIALQVASFKADYNTNTVAIKWNKSTDAAVYNVYVKNAKHPSWLLLSGNAGVGDNFSNVQRHSVTLNSTALDLIINGGSVEPFALNSACSLKVVPVNGDGIEGAAATHAVFGLKDEVQPTIYDNVTYTTKTDANMDNTSGASVTIDFTVEFSEYMNTSGTPTIGIVGGGFGTVTFSNWTWGASEGTNGKNSATFQITIPNNINLDGQNISISNINDLSGNSISTSVTISLIDS